MKLLVITIVAVLSIMICLGLELLTKGTPAGIEITLSRVFGSCADEYAGVTDVSKAVGECGVIQVIINKFNAENSFGAVISTQSVQAGGYYDRLSAAFAARRPPDIALMHNHLLYNFEERGLLTPLGKELEAAGVDWSDFVSSSLEGTEFRGEKYALPFDVHALLWHVNLDLFQAAGLMAADGAPLFPRSPEELISQAEQLKERTGKRYFAIPSVMDPMPSGLFLAWVWQQRGDLLFPGRMSTGFESPAARRALELLNTLYERDFANRGQDYTGAEQAFLSGEAAVLVNGTWVVDSLLTQSKRSESGLHRYAAYTLPTLFQVPAVPGGSHVWVRPRGGDSNPKKDEAVLGFLRFLYDQSSQWARTGHLPVRKSVLKNDAFLNLPLRRGYADTAGITRSLPPMEHQQAIQYILVQEINATWLANRSPAQSLAEAGRQIDEIVRRDERQPAPAK